MIEMTLSEDGEIELIGHEAVVLTRYRDSKGIWTIGVGHTALAGGIDPAKFTGRLSLKQVFELFQHDVKRYADAVCRALHAPVKQTQFDALVSFHYNTGAINHASVVRLINEGRIKEAGKSLMLYNKPKEVIPRRQKEQKLFNLGVYSNNGQALIVPANPAGRLNWGGAKRIDVAKEMKAA